MATTGPPFDKPMPELREAFVRARFAQEDVFGKPNIEEWLATQQEAERPSEKTWERFLGRGTLQPWADRDFFDLRSHATSLGVLNERFGSVGEADAYGPIYDRLAFVPRGIDPRRGLYSGDAGMLYVEDHVHGPMFVVREEWDKGGGVTITRVRNRSKNPGARTLLGVVFAEWLQRRPKRKEARASLCRAFESEIADERAKAEADFDSAVAVSTDGKKICSADWVCVFGASSAAPPPSDRHGLSDPSMFHATDYLFPASAFKEQKALLTPRTREEDLPPSAGPYGAGTFKNTWAAAHRSVDETLSAPEQFYGKWYRMELAHTRCHHPRQALLVCKDGRILFVHRDQCPSPLPEGGVELTV